LTCLPAGLLPDVRQPAVEPKLRGQPPPLAVAPFTPEDARKHQERWAKYLGVGGSTTPWFFGDDEANLEKYAWYDDNREGLVTKAAGVKLPNGFGARDTSGNVYEWCSDWFRQDYYSLSAREDPKGPSSGDWRVVRGGSFVHGAWEARSARRVGFPPDCRIVFIGFRVARTIDVRSGKVGGDVNPQEAKRSRPEQPDPSVTPKPPLE